MLDRAVETTIVRPAAWLADGLTEVRDAWRHHLVVPGSIEDLRRLNEEGPSPVEPRHSPRVLREVTTPTPLTRTIHVQDNVAQIIATVLDRLHAPYRAWRDHVAWPSSIEHLKRLVRDGPDGVTPGRGISTQQVRDFLWPREDTAGQYHAMCCVLDVAGLDTNRARRLYEAGYVSVADVRRASPEELKRVKGVGDTTLETLKKL